MKKISAICLFFLFANSQKVFAFTDSLVDAKQHKIKRFYFGFGIGTGYKGMGYAAEVGIIKKNDWGLIFSLFGNEYAATNKPADYNHPMGIFNFNLFGSSERPLLDLADFVSLLVAKDFPGRSKSMRFNISAGPSIGHHRTLMFTPIPEERGGFLYVFNWYSGNYKTSTTKILSAGLSLKSSIRFMPSKYFSVQLAAFANINTQQSYAGLQLEFLFGRLREGQKRR
jgi:hypothetical protein